MALPQHHQLFVQGGRGGANKGSEKASKACETTQGKAREAAEGSEKAAGA